MLGKINQIFKKLVYAGIFASILLAGTAGKAMSAPDSNSIVIDDIEFYVETDKSIYYLGEKVQMLYRLTKLGPPSASILCHQSPPLNLVVLKDGKTVWMKVQDWWQWVGELQLFPNIPVEITADWEMNDLNDVPVEPGTYDVLGVIYDCIGLPDVGAQITILPVPRTITVGLGAGYDFNTIQASINDSNDGDTIIVADGTYTGNGNRDIDFLGKAITLRSENGPENCIIDCNGTEIDPHRGFIFQSGEELDSVVEGFTITNGYAPMEETDPPFDIYESVGGAILCWGSSPTINHCVFTGNSANSVDSFAYGFGGAISCMPYYESPTITNCVFNGNSAEHGGGVSIRWSLSSPILTNCTFSNNSANGNNPDGPGGGMYIQSSNPVLLNCTFSGNSANGDVGGGIFCYDSEPIITNCIFWGNTDTGGTDESAQISCNSGNPVINYTCIQGLTGLFGGIGNIGENPFLGDPCNGDYHLKSEAGRWEPASESWVQDDVTSPCIDAGNPGCPIGDEPAPNGNRRNMGAYGGTAEASKSPTYWRSIADLTNDWIVDSNDLKVFVGYWLEMGECIPGDLNHNQSTNSADFALLANNWHQSGPGKSVFDFAVATKGPLHLDGNIEPEGVNISIESDVYIVSENSNLVLEMIGNSHINGDVFIVNPFGSVDIQGGDASIGGETAPGAYDHVFNGVFPIEFPVPNPDYFEHYVVEDINLADTTFTNVRVPPNTNPIFGGGVTFFGVLFIETPNLVTFSGNVNITGIIVGNGDVTDDSGTNRIDFLGTVNSNPVSMLPEEFGDLREETGTFLMAPGFSLSFNGNFETINGAVAANGITFSGNAGGTIEGSVLNYSETEMELSINNALFINRYVNTEMPAGFE